jgi:hypothetical protein
MLETTLGPRVNNMSCKEELMAKKEKGKLCPKINEQIKIAI